jgi:hypothetical protein
MAVGKQPLAATRFLNRSTCASATPTLLLPTLLRFLLLPKQSSTTSSCIAAPNRAHTFLWCRSVPRSEELCVARSDELCTPRPAAVAVAAVASLISRWHTMLCTCRSRRSNSSACTAASSDGCTLRVIAGIVRGGAAGARSMEAGVGAVATSAPSAAAASLPAVVMVRVTRCLMTSGLPLAPPIT